MVKRHLEQNIKVLISNREIETKTDLQLELRAKAKRKEKAKKMPKNNSKRGELHRLDQRKPLFIWEKPSMTRITFRFSVRWTCRRRLTRSSLPFAFLVGKASDDGSATGSPKLQGKIRQGKQTNDFVQTSRKDTATPLLMKRTIQHRLPFTLHRKSERQMQRREFQSEDKTQYRVRLNHLADKYVLKRRKWRHTLGVIQTGSQTSPKPNAPTFEQGSIQWTSSMDRTRNAAWILHKSVF